MQKIEGCFAQWLGRATGYTGTVLLTTILLTVSVPARAAAPCEIEIKPIWQEAEGLRSQLESDPFVSAFGTFIKDLKDNAAELQQWRSAAEDYRDRVCIPYNRDAAAYEGRVQNFINQGCTQNGIEPGLYAWCVPEHSALENLKRDLDFRLANNVTPGEDRLNDWGGNLVTKEEQAVQHAKEMLDAGNAENAFRLYAFSVKKKVDAGSLTSCQAFAQMSDALVSRSGGQYGKHLMLMGAVLAPTANPFVFGAHPRSVVFTATGFRRKYIGPPGRERDNQVRHATAYIMAGSEFGAGGAKFGTYMEDKFTMWLNGRVPEEYDYLLGIAAGEIGRDLRGGMSASELGNSIRSKLCGM